MDWVIQPNEEKTLVLDPFYEQILEAAPDAVLLSSPEGKILFANEEASTIFGYGQEEFRTLNIDQLVPQAVRGHHKALREQYYADPHKRPMGIGLELIGERKDGQAVAVEISLSTLTIHSGIYVISIIRDVTEIRKMARDLQTNNLELKRSNEDLERFAGIASHDLQEPLRMIAGYTQLLQKRYKTQLDSEGHEYLNFVFEGVKRLQNLIQDLLTFSRLTSKTRPFSAVDLNEILFQVQNNLEVLIQEKNASIEVDHLPTIQGDPVQMTQLFQNLVANSLKFSHEAPKVQIKALKTGDYWHIGVLDNGIGIPKDFRERVFGIFQRLHSHEAYPGTGMGLAICKRIIERHHGEIWIEDAPPGQLDKPEQGTAIWMTLPASLNPH